MEDKQMKNLINVANQDGSLVVSSREVAENFEKRHPDTIRAIEILADETSTQNCTHLFIPSTYKDSYGREQKEYLLTRDGFTLLAMGFTGQKALQWKLKYIEAFNKMEEKLKQGMPNMSQAEIIAMMAQNNVEIEKKANKALEIAEKADRQISNALDVFTAPPEKNWRESMNSKMRAICTQYKLSYPVFYGELYAELELMAGVNLSARLSRLKNRMLENGATKTDCRKITKLEVVARDKQLRQIFEGIVRKYQSKYAIDEYEL